MSGNCGLSTGHHSRTSGRQLLGINLYHDAGTSASMSDHGRMHSRAPDAAGCPAPGDAPSAVHLHPRVTSFRTRRSALSGGQQATWERRWPELGTYARDADGPRPLLDTASWFGRTAPIVLEIGCGAGTSTVSMAQAEPHLDVVAVEVYRKGLAQLLGAIDREGIT